MSIINDALKKTGKSITRQENKQGKRRTFYLLSALAISLLIFLVNRLPAYLRHREIPPDAPVAKASAEKNTPLQEPPTPAAPPAPESTPGSEAALEKEKAEEEFVLNGIFISEDGDYALINNKIVRKDETIRGARIKNISPENVELELKGRLINLSTRNR